MRLFNENLIKGHEGLRLKAYKPTPHDVWTIGWGHTKGVYQGMEISMEIAQDYFEQDVKWAVDAVNREVKVGLTQNQFDALVSFAFNVGETNFKRSTLLKKLNAGDYHGAAAEFPKWNKQRQNGKMVVLRGLVKRRNEEMELFLDPVDEVPSRNFLTENDTNGILKPLNQSKEILSGAGGVVAGATGLLGSVATLAPELQGYALTGLSVALLAFGAFVVYNRLVARNRGER